MKKTILYVEEDDLWIDRVVPLLVAAGHTVEFVKTIQGARSLLSIQKFDLVICDGHIEERYDGNFLARDLQQEGNVVLLLTFSSPLKGLNYVDKFWFEEQEFLKTVSCILGKRRI